MRKLHKRKFTVKTQLHERNNKDIIEYMEDARVPYAKAKRETFHYIRKTPKFNKASYNTYLQKKYGLTKRTANSIISDANGALNALKELKLYEKSVLELKIAKFKDEIIPELERELADYKTMLRLGIGINLTKYKNLKRKIVSKKNKLNRLNQRFRTVNNEINTGKYKFSFGTKKLMEKDYQAFIAQRDSQMSFVGSKSESKQNQNLQLTYDKKINQFHVKIRKDFNHVNDATDRFAYGKVYFNHHKKEIIEILKVKNSPLSYKIIKKNGRYYLYCIFEIQIESGEFRTRNDYGTIGLDFNKGFITATETNQYGHMLDHRIYHYRFKQGNATKTDFEKLINEIVNWSLETGKDIVIETLDFTKKKSKTVSKKNKKYNEMLHSLAYRKFTHIMESIAYRNYVYLRKVNPAWTSWIAKKKYCPTMKLNTHVGASFVIARRGQGFKDKV